MQSKSGKIILYLLIFFNTSVFLLYGIFKLVGWQFAYRIPPPDLLLKDVRPTGIMWYFFSLSKGYAALIAFSEILPAILIIFKRTRFIGAFLYLITAINILAINIFFQITMGTLIISSLVFINAIIIFYSERGKIKFLFS